MKTLVDHLSQYASYHRDRRNVWTHVIGIPTIVVSITTALQAMSLGSVAPEAIASSAAMVWLNAATLVSLLATVFYLRLDLRYGTVMGVLLALSCLLGQSLALSTALTWWQMALALFVVGWVFQFVGHYFEGKKPAFVDDLVGLLIGPLFVVAELGFMMGMRDEVNNQVMERAGPLR